MSGLRPEFFDEAELINNSQGVLGGDGFQHIETITAKPIPTRPGVPSPGYQFELHCLSCSDKQGIMVSWLELIELAGGAIPTDRDANPPTPWRYVDRKVTPVVYCARGHLIACYMTPDEAQRYVNIGIQMGALNRNVVEQKIREIQAAVAAHQQRR